MEVLDDTSLADRLRSQDKEYWLHMEADTPLEKYPGKQAPALLSLRFLLIRRSQTTCAPRAGKAGHRPRLDLPPRPAGSQQSRQRHASALPPTALFLLLERVG